MGVTVKIPTPLRRVTGGQREVQIEAATIAELIAQLDQQYPGMRERLCGDDGQLRPFLNIYVKGEDIRFRDGVNTALQPGDDVSIIPAVAGG